MLSLRFGCWETSALDNEDDEAARLYFERRLSLRTTTSFPHRPPHSKSQTVPTLDHRNDKRFILRAPAPSRRRGAGVGPGKIRRVLPGRRCRPQPAAHGDAPAQHAHSGVLRKGVSSTPCEAPGVAGRTTPARATAGARVADLAGAVPYGRLRTADRDCASGGGGEVPAKVAGVSGSAMRLVDSLGDIGIVDLGKVS